MGGYVDGHMYTLKPGEIIAVRTISQFHVRTVGGTARVLLDVNQPGNPITVAANSGTWLKKPAGVPNDPTVEAVGGFVVINDPLGSGLPEPVHYW